jgi:hypothetical protein
MQKFKKRHFLELQSWSFGSSKRHCPYKHSEPHGFYTAWLQSVLQNKPKLWKPADKLWHILPLLPYNFFMMIMIAIEAPAPCKPGTLSLIFIFIFLLWILRFWMQIHKEKLTISKLAEPKSAVILKVH